jgi:hypothetical protein
LARSRRECAARSSLDGLRVRLAQDRPPRGHSARSRKRERERAEEQERERQRERETSHHRHHLSLALSFGPERAWSSARTVRGRGVVILLVHRVSASSLALVVRVVASHQKKKHSTHTHKKTGGLREQSAMLNSGFGGNVPQYAQQTGGFPALGGCRVRGVAWRARRKGERGRGEGERENDSLPFFSLRRRRSPHSNVPAQQRARRGGRRACSA